MSKLNQGFCPKCKSNWDGGSILETFIAQRNQGVNCWQGKSYEELQECVEEFYSPPYRWGRQIGIELEWNHPKHYDGVSYIQCPDCKTTFNRFTGEEENID